MNSQKTDLTFFTNDQNQTLLDRFKATLADTRFIDELVYELNFPDEIKGANKENLPHLGELEPLNDTMSEEEKFAIIQREFDPNHPVRNNLEIFDSVDVVRTIHEALKR